ncbi:4'-phosphopantetheinyl transferase family protein [Psittacicella gerlachiana]|uniref:4'-phosphopantetheinyl transferase domain-containing protein n=1 Tax=Psittacicella gerlachiana TaxID=2028574 RepID=A0A3A1Y111_9GAMM|nr:4'-phosphopantetheinyl transferase superfamily protein [Psittacicella gerlachiana]RIY31933.1 hypothetical protein CKF59_07315 [Psittacicella gerlachiana]
MQANIYLELFHKDLFVNYWQGLQKSFPELPAYKDLPRTALGRPYLPSYFQGSNPQFPYLESNTPWFIDFNLAHSDDKVLVAILLSENPPPVNSNSYLGVDLEFKTNSQKISEKAFLRRIIHPDNLKLFTNSSNKEQNKLLEWVIKEAIVKSYALSIFQGNKIKFSPQGIEANLNSTQKGAKIYTFIDNSSYYISLCLNHQFLLNFCEPKIIFANKIIPSENPISHFSYLYANHKADLLIDSVI